MAANIEASNPLGVPAGGEDTRINVTPQAGRSPRRRKPPKAQAGGGPALPILGGCDGSDSDGDGGRDPRRRAYRGACPIGQFFLDPCLFLAARARRCRLFLSSRLAQSPRGGRPGRRKRGRRDGGPTYVGRDFVAALVSAVVVAVVVASLCQRAPPGGGHRRVGGDVPPVRIGALDLSAVGDVGGWMTPYEFPPPSSLGPLRGEEKEGEAYRPNFGGLKIQSLAGESGSEFRRTINYAFEEKYQNRAKTAKDPHVSHHYAFDDDYRLDPVCRRNNWWSLYSPNCNAFHEVDLPRKFDNSVVVVTEEQSIESHYISHGFYRDVWLVENHAFESDNEGMALKLLRWKHNLDYKSFETVRKDALVMERLTHSPRIMDIYGHCAFSVTVEALDKEVEEFVVPGSGYAKQEDLEDSEDVDIKNDFNVTEKVEIALAMAESIADLHGFKDGIIVHDDVQLCQWLRTKDGTLKLGDFNRAEVMLWDEEAQQYCKYNNGKGYGNYRAPEEFDAEDLNEQIDVYSMGNNIYGLLTGLWVFYENEDDEVVQGKIIAGETSYIDERYRTRSYAEGRLVEIMERCWVKDPDKRATIFEVVTFLRETLAEHKKLEGQKHKYSPGSNLGLSRI